MRSPSTGAVGDLSSALFPVGRRRLQPTAASPVEGLQMASDFHHSPVLLREVLDLFAPVPSGVILDATLGGAGHA
jgi:hypothetical protein